MQELEKILEGIENLHTKILNDGFARKVTEQEIMALVDAKDIIRKHMNDGWIPVKEQLPERRGNYLATAESAGVRFRLISHYNAPGWTEEYGGQKIIAWQPLPELYGEEKDVGQ